MAISPLSEIGEQGLSIACFASTQAVEGLKRGTSHDTYICAAGYLIGEYGASVKSVTPLEQFKLLQASFLTSAVDTKVGSFLEALLGL